MWKIGRRARVAGPVRLVAALVVVLGIFGMHALGHHGTAHPASGGHVGASEAAQHEVGSLPPGTAPGDGAPSGVANRPSFGSGPDRAMSGLAMLCVGVLAAAGIVLGRLAFVRRSLRLWALLPPALTYAAPLRRLARVDTGPPPVWQFSVIRC